MRYGLFNANSHTVVDTYNAVSSGGEGGSNAMSGTGPKIRNVAALARAGAAPHGLDASSACPSRT